MAQAKLVKRQRSTSGQARSADLIRPFTGHLYCEHCGSAFYSRKSSNSKGIYVYCQCGCRQRLGPESCGNTITFREDKLLSSLQEVCSRVFSDIDAMAVEATKEAELLAQVNRVEADRLRGQLAQVDREISSVSGLLVDPDVMGARSH
jgi:Fe2+ or Zn2+ uptake regulation protein